jgi:asparagine synthase (glutamine-hydrolysing)
LPENILNRPKQGFPVPVYGWLSGPLRDWAHGLLGSGAPRLHDWMGKDQINSILEKATSPGSRSKDQRQAWQLLVLELWMRRWVTNQGLV